MSVVSTVDERGPYTRADLDALPDDGLRHELIDGVFVMSPSPGSRHQRSTLRLAMLLEQARRDDVVEVMISPFDVALSDDTVVVPDVLVARSIDITERDLPVAPLLAVEVLSPSTRHVDLNRKRRRYERAGCPSYWVVDPDGPSLTAWELRDGGYGQIAHVAGDEVFRAERPYPVEVVPIRLLQR